MHAREFPWAAGADVPHTLKKRAQELDEATDVLRSIDIMGGDKLSLRVSRD